MTRRRKVTTIATVALLSGIATMFLLHSFRSPPSLMGHEGFDGMFPMAGMGSEMDWMMFFGPLGMMLFFGGFVTFIVLLIASLFQSSAKST